MRGFTWKSILCLALAFVCAVPAPAWAAGRGARGQKIARKDADKAFDLNEIVRLPKHHLERQVFFYARFAAHTELFKLVHTRFDKREHANFAVWPDKTILWDENERKDKLCPTLYVSKWDKDSLEVLRKLEKYDLIAITAQVLNDYANQPWFLVTKIEVVQQDCDRLCDQTVQHMQMGLEALDKDYGGVAARHFEQALELGLPPEYLSRAYQHTACAYYKDNKLDRSQDYLREACLVDDADPLNHLALADVSVRVNDPEEAIAHCIATLERTGKYPQAYGIMGEAESMMGNEVKGFRNINQALNTPGITPREKAMLTVRQARIYNNVGRFEDASKMYVSASEPSAELANEAWLHNEMGLFYEKMFLIAREDGDDPLRYIEEAIHSYEIAVDKSGATDHEILYNLAAAEFSHAQLTESTDFSQVREQLERVYAVAPEYPPARILQARILYAEGEVEAAEELYLAMSWQIANSAQSMLAIAEAYRDMEDYDQAAATAEYAKGIAIWDLRVRALADYLSNERKTVSMRPAIQPATEGTSAPEAEYEDEPSATQLGSFGQPKQGAGYRLIAVRPGETIRVAEDGSVQVESGKLDTAPVAVETPAIKKAPEPAAAPAVSSKYSINDVQTQQPPAIPANVMESMPKWPVTEVNLDDAIMDWQKTADEDLRRAYEEHGISMTGTAGSAYASLSLDAASGSRTLPAFSFAPDRSPLIIANHRSPANGRPMPVRNANLYRSKGDRQPAEVIEKEPVDPRVEQPDMSVMAPPQDGRTRRAEVRMPTSSIGIGMASDYMPRE